MRKTTYRQPNPIARQHAEWLSLLDISGPFLSMPVLREVFPQGLEKDAPDLKRALRAAYEEWLDNQGSTRADPAIHRAWAEWVLRHVLDIDDEVLCLDEAGLSAWAAPSADGSAPLAPDMAFRDPDDPAVAHLLVQVVPKGQGLESSPAGRHTPHSPAARMQDLLKATRVPLGLVTNGEQWMLVHALPEQSTGYISWYAELWLAEPLTLQAFRTLLRVMRLVGAGKGETLRDLLARSASDQEEVTDQLGLQVREALAILVRTIDRADQDRGGRLLRGIPEAQLYEAGVTVMMRLVFLLSAEERGLLLLGDPLYDEHYAASTLRAQLQERADQAGEEVLERHHDAWCRLLSTFRAVYAGARHDQLHLAAYGGGLFDPDRFPFLEGRPAGSGWRTTPADPLPIDNRTVLHLLSALQMLRVPGPQGGPAEARRLSFRALDVVQIGHVYEGLLDHTARRAAEPVLGLERAGDKVADLPLPALEEQAARGQDALIRYLRAETGRSLSALKKGLQAGADLETAPRLRAACVNDDPLYARVLPYAGVLRKDDYGQPLVVPVGSVYVTAGRLRRATGTHYTPRLLTEPIVQHTLEPQVYEGPAEGRLRDRWRLRTAPELLGLRVCDIAMGSGAFLVETCRYLSECVVQAWGEREANLQRRHAGEIVLITPEGERTGDLHQSIPADADERLRLARRLVADRCLYGVDKNPLAVEMAKLSLWLVTMEKDKPFSFLDHALKCGDSLVGVDRRQLQFWTLHPKPNAGSGYEPFGTEIDIEKVVARRREIAALPDRDVRDQQVKEVKLADAEALTNHLRTGADLLVSSYLAGLKGPAAERLRERLWRAFRLGADAPLDAPDLTTCVPGGVSPFHWELEFPEVSEEGGFHAIVGNPPFMGGLRLSTNLGTAYLDYLRRAWPDAAGTMDLCGFFYRRAFQKLRPGGALGLIATNTIAQGDTREGGLDRILAAGGRIYRAENDVPWPGRAAVVVDVVHLISGLWQANRALNGKPVRTISAYLDGRAVTGSPQRLAANEGLSFIGSYVLGMGFVLEPQEAEALIDKDPRKKHVLFPYLNGEDLNSRPDQSPSRWVINFFDWPLERGAPGQWVGASAERQRKWLQEGRVPGDYVLPVAADYPDCLAVVRDRVCSERQKLTTGNSTSRRRRHFWWQYGASAAALYQAIASLRRALVTCRVSNTHALTFLSANQVFSDATVVFDADDAATFAILQGSAHESWARQYSSTLKGDMRYSPTDCVQTFAFPDILEGLACAGEAYHEYRRQIMLARQEGLTATYNRFHDAEETAADIARLRELHREMDQAVAAAYGWGDLDLGHGFHEAPQGSRYTISAPARDEVLDRLLALNQERYEDEVRHGLHEKKGRGKGRLV